MKEEEREQFSNVTQYTKVDVQPGGINIQHVEHFHQADVLKALGIDLPSIIRDSIKSESDDAVSDTSSEDEVDEAIRNDYGFDRDTILSFITDDDKEIMADILVELMGPYKGKNQPKEGLLPFYCAVYETGWIATRPKYNEFIKAFPNIINGDNSYSQYVPTEKIRSNYSKENCTGIDIESMCETMENKLNTRKARNKEA